jgi:hypothetical protein
MTPSLLLLAGLLAAAQEPALPEGAGAGGQPAGTAAEAAPAPVATVHVDRGDKGATLRLVVRSASGRPALPDAPEVAGLTFGPATDRTERVGAEQITTRSWPLTVGPGEHELAGLCADVGGTAVCAEPVWIDGAGPPARDGFVDVIAPPAPPRPWPWAAALGAALAVGAAVLAWRRRRVTEVVPVAPAAAPLPPPHVEALDTWARLRADPALTDDARAKALSALFRRYLQRALGFPAEAYATSETLRHLRGLSALAAVEVERASRLLRATDRVKYAEARPGERFFDALDADLRGFIDATRPATPAADGREGGA